MKKLTDYKDEIHKCSKCGLCQSVCPIYQITGNDCSVSRGKFIMLNGIIKGDLKLNKNVNKYLDMCLKCNACKDFCPSGIDARKIFLTAKSEYFQNCPSSLFIKAFQSKFVFDLVLNLIKIASYTYRGIKLDKFVRKFYPILQKMGWLGKKIILANEFVSNNAKCKRQKAKNNAIPNEERPLGMRHCEERGTSDAAIQEKKTFGLPRQGFSLPRNDAKKNINLSKVVYFKGCVNEYINPKAKIATENVLGRMGVEIVKTNFDCCGVPFLSCGNAEQFKKQAEFNLSQIPDDFDFFLTDCASCQNAFFEYENYIEDEKLLEKLKKINEKSINVVDFIVKHVKSFEFREKTTFTFHKPCHLESMDFLKEFLAKAQNVEYIEMNDFDKCCGFSGEFAIKNTKLSAQISSAKAENALATKADYILTSCPACVLGITQGMIENNEQMQIMNLVEFIALADSIVPKESQSQENEQNITSEIM